MIKIIEKENFTAIEPILSNPNGQIKKFFRDSLLSFFDEMDLYISENADNGFWTYQIERTLLSMYLNGIIRTDFDRNVTLLQEYSVWDRDNKSRGRCDAFINYNGNAILLEAKRDSESTMTNDSHWDISEWIKWDDERIGNQLMSYYLAQEDFMQNDTYDSCHLMTLVFDNIAIQPYDHIEAVNQNLARRINEEYSKDWFYTFLFDEKQKKGKNNIGLEIYGTLKKVYPC